VDVRAYTVGPFQENTYVLRADGSDRAIVIDPGDAGPQLLEAIGKLGATVEAILITHTDVDHVGAVAPLAKATGATVYCPKLEVERLQDIMGHVSMEGIGPYEGYDPEETVEGGETLEIAGLKIEVVATPGHTEGHVTYVFPDETLVLPGHMGTTTLGREKATNPFLAEIAQ
jgi:hydroxyacylglutathione hydrolase